MNIELPSTPKRQGRFGLLVFGGRTFNQEHVLFEPLDQVLMQCEQRELRLQVIQGGAKGADALARAWAEYQDGAVDLFTEKAEWTKHGRVAGPKRNQLMLDRHQPDFYIAAPGDRGTMDMLRRVKAANIPGLFCGAPKVA